MRLRKMDPSPSEKIKHELLSWEGVTILAHNFVAVMFFCVELP
jgi:hypothetical protein